MDIALKGTVYLLRGLDIIFIRSKLHFQFLFSMYVTCIDMF